MPIPQIPSPLLAILAAKTYNAAWFSGTTDEAQIQSAIVQAAADGAEAVFVPANFLPYDASLVTFNTSVKMIRENGKNTAYDIRAYGAAGDNVTDDVHALQGACAGAVANGGEVFAPKGIYRYSARIFEITNKCVIRGEGQRITIFKPLSTYAGFAIRINDCWRNGAEEASGLNTVNFSTSKVRVTLEDFSIIGDRANICRGIQTYDRVDWLVMRNVDVTYMNGYGVQFGVEQATNAIVREGQFYNLQIRSCGNATEQALFITNGDSAGDGTNQLDFFGLGLVYNYGVAMKICSNIGATNKNVRRINFYSLMMHGRNTLADAPAADLIQVVGDVQNIMMYGAKMNGSHDVGGVKYAVMRFSADANGDYPQYSKFDMDMRSCQGHGIIVEQAGALEFEGTIRVSDIAGNEMTIGNAAMIAWGRYALKGAAAGRTIVLGTGNARMDWQNHQQEVDGWTFANIPANQAAVELTAGRVRFTAKRDGSLTGVFGKLNEARTAGTVTIEVWKNTGLGGAAGSATGLIATINGSNTNYADNQSAPFILAYSAGDEIYLKLTSASWTPTTSDLVDAGFLYMDH